MGMGESQEGGPDFGIVPGDGGGALAPLFFSPPLAKEALMLGRRFTAPELVELGAINYAVPASQLDAKADELVQALLRRSSYALAWTKRIANRRVAEQLNMALDAGAAYEMVNFLQLERLQ
jgi:enoyl-CoA hydratase/carnithine racemase